MSALNSDGARESDTAPPQASLESGWEIKWVDNVRGLSGLELKKAELAGLPLYDCLLAAGYSADRGVHFFMRSRPHTESEFRLNPVSGDHFKHFHASLSDGVLIVDSGAKFYGSVVVFLDESVMNERIEQETVKVYLMPDCAESLPGMPTVINWRRVEYTIGPTGRIGRLLVVSASMNRDRMPKPQGVLAVAFNLTGRTEPVEVVSDRHIRLGENRFDASDVGNGGIVPVLHGVPNSDT